MKLTNDTALGALCAYVGTPFVDRGRSREGADCWGLLRLVYQDLLGVELPSYVDEYDSVDSEDPERLIARDRDQWIQVADPEPYDGILLRQGGQARHVAIVADRTWMLHTNKASGAVLERYRSPRWAPLIEGFFRLP